MKPRPIEVYSFSDIIYHICDKLNITTDDFYNHQYLELWQDFVDDYLTEDTIQCVVPFDLNDLNDDVHSVEDFKFLKVIDRMFSNYDIQWIDYGS